MLCRASTVSTVSIYLQYSSDLLAKEKENFQVQNPIIQMRQNALYPYEKVKNVEEG
jgi:hypothetical protein